MSTRRSSQQTIKMGWVEKKSKHLGIFRKRWIECYIDDKLCSFKHTSDNSPSEIIDLSAINKAYQSNLGDNEFIIAYLEDRDITSRRFRTSTHQEALEWIDFFNQTSDAGNCKCRQCLESKYEIDRHMITRSESNISKKKIKRSSLDDIIEEIAVDVTNNHQYLKVVLESGNNRSNINDQRFPTQKDIFITHYPFSKILPAY